ncbi:uncharacterized protein LOC142980523 [Anticarsia gemmatalis]|uniref:uncharacterized protein LOC142980523 n=1 Tax=Anticarsia gemmatalis TaxID=129554 RepID=UPI003F759258
MHSALLWFIIPLHYCLADYIDFYCSDTGPKDLNTIRLIYDYQEIDQENVTINRLNERFIEKCRDFYTIELEPVENIGIETTLEKIKNSNNIINLYAYDYYEYKRNKNITNYEELTYAGDVYDDNNDTAIELEEEKKRWYKPSPPLDDTNVANSSVFVCPRRCNKTAIIRPAVKVISNEIANLNSGHLFNFITSIHFSGGQVQSWRTCSKNIQDHQDLKTVVICTDVSLENKLRPYSSSMDFKYIEKNQCEDEIKKLGNNLLAVISATPFEMNAEFSIPTVFYKIPYMDPGYLSQFPNAVHLVDDKLLKHAILRTIEEAGWQRVAIISDDSLYSIELEDELVQEFNRKKMIYNVQRCEKAVCNVEEALSNLLRMRTRIIVANVEEKNARKLYDLVHKSSRHVTFLFRVWPFWDHTQQPVGQSLSITLGPQQRETEKKCFRNIEREPSYLAIYEGLRRIYLARQYYSTSESSRRDFNEHFKSQLNSSETVAYVRRPNKLLSTMSLSKNGVEKYKKIEDLFERVPNDGPNCYRLTKNFAKPCDPTAVVLIMLVIIAFSIALLLILFFFDDFSHIAQYQQM